MEETYSHGEARSKT